MDHRASLDVEDLLKIVLVLIIVLLVVDIVTDVLSSLLGPVQPALGLLVLVLIIYWVVDRL
jgi:hypothetical protein